jgi:hypothetical protein
MSIATQTLQERKEDYALWRLMPGDGKANIRLRRMG